MLGFDHQKTVKAESSGILLEEEKPQDETTEVREATPILGSIANSNCQSN